MSNELKLLSEKYTQIFNEYDSSWATGGAGGTAYAGSETAMEDSESVLEPEQQPVAMDSQIIGLFDPSTSEEKKQTDEALKELDIVLKNITKELQDWQKKYSTLGASDSVAKEQLFQYIAKSVLGLKKID